VVNDTVRLSIRGQILVLAKLFVHQSSKFSRLTKIKMQTTISRLLRFNLHIYGIWPYVPSTVLFRLYWIIMLSTAQVFQYRYVIVNIHMDDFSELMDGIGSAMASSLLYIKLVLLWSNQRYNAFTKYYTNLACYRIHYKKLISFIRYRITD